MLKSLEWELLALNSQRILRYTYQAKTTGYTGAGPDKISKAATIRGQNGADGQGDGTTIPTCLSKCGIR